MNMQLKITKIGNSAGIILSKELLARLHSEVGGCITAVMTENGIELRPQEDGFEKQMAAARDVMTRRKRALRELAK
jgi:putative addiction module antidote